MRQKCMSFYFGAAYTEENSIKNSVITISFTFLLKRLFVVLKLFLQKLGVHRSCTSPHSTNSVNLCDSVRKKHSEICTVAENTYMQSHVRLWVSKYGCSARGVRPRSVNDDVFLRAHSNFHYLCVCAAPLPSTVHRIVEVSTEFTASYWLDTEADMSTVDLCHFCVCTHYS